MKLEEGMYVRTKEGEISKIKWITVQRWEGLDNTIEASFMLENKENIEYPRDNFKASHELIDLIEVGDYVNGLRINSITEVDENHDVRLVWNLTTYGDDDISFSNEEIKSIVTKELFESIKYEVG